MNILLVAATEFEITPLLKWLNEQFESTAPHTFKFKNLQLDIVITGVGLPITAFHLGQRLPGNYHWLINAGIAGAFDTKLAIGEVVQVISERFGDLGVEEANGQFTSIFELGLLPSEQFPFSGGRLWNPASAEYGFLPQVHSLSVQKVHGYPPSIEQIKNKYPDAQVESMEGAAFFYAALMTKCPFVEIRSISNFVEARNRDNWNIPLAIGKLNEVLINMVKLLV